MICCIIYSELASPVTLNSVSGPSSPSSLLCPLTLLSLSLCQLRSRGTVYALSRRACCQLRGQPFLHSLTTDMTAEIEVSKSDARPARYT